ncbi:MAG: phage terminase large subunit [Solirubrobacteraceae bacterium]
MTDLADLRLTEEELDRLTPEDLEAYQEAIEAAEAEWTLTPKQARAERMAGEVDELMYGGAAGGGKTEWMLWHAYHHCLAYPGLKVLAVRRTFPQLKRSLIERSLERFDQREVTYKVGDKEWVFHNGSKITFGHLDLEEDVRHYLSAQYDMILFEELTEFTERQYRLLVSRCRTTAKKRAQGVRPHCVAATNPGQVGHAWVKEFFVKATGYGEHIAISAVEFGGRKRERTIAFVPARVDDNPHIDPDYVFNLAMLGDTERRQYLEGDWDIFEGQFFTEWRRDLHVVKPFIVPASWPRWRAIDYGFRAPFACLWFTADFDANVYAYREVYATGLTATQQAKAILAASKMANGRTEKVDYTVADPSIWTKQGTGLSIAQMYRDAGLTCRKAMNARLDGWARVRDYLRGGTVTEEGERFDHPHLRVFPGCENLIRTLPDLVHDKVKVEDLDTHGDDHAADALRYGLMSRSKVPTRRKAPKGSIEEDVDRILARRARASDHEVLGRM